MALQARPTNERIPVKLDLSEALARFPDVQQAYDNYHAGKIRQNESIKGWNTTLEVSLKMSHTVAFDR